MGDDKDMMGDVGWGTARRVRTVLQFVDLGGDWVCWRLVVLDILFVELIWAHWREMYGG